MKVHLGGMSIVAFALAAILVTGTFLSEQFPQAAEAHSVGFDALAHSLFDGLGNGVGNGFDKSGAGSHL